MLYRQPDGGAFPATFESPGGDRLAVWQTDVWGLDWIKGLVTGGRAMDLGGVGFPTRYTATAECISPQFSGEPPRAHLVWTREVGDTVNEKWAGRTVIDDDVVAACSPDEWLLIEAWDESWPRSRPAGPTPTLRYCCRRRPKMKYAIGPAMSMNTSAVHIRLEPSI